MDSKHINQAQEVLTFNKEASASIENSEKSEPAGVAVLEDGEHIPVNQYELTAANNKLNYFGKGYVLL